MFSKKNEIEELKDRITNLEHDNEALLTEWHNRFLAMLKGKEKYVFKTEFDMIYDQFRLNFIDLHKTQNMILDYLNVETKTTPEKTELVKKDKK